MKNNKQKLAAKNEIEIMKDFSLFTFHFSLISRKSHVC